MDKSEARQDILQYIRFDKYGIEKEIEKKEKEVLELFDEDNGEDILIDSSEWNEEYISSLLVKLRKNFSRKKLKLIIEVRNQVRGKIKEPEIKNHNPNNNKFSQSEEKIRTDEKKEYTYGFEKQKEDDGVVQKIRKFLKKKISLPQIKKNHEKKEKMFGKYEEKKKK
ncbi:MAG: hypothetical protein ACRC0R_01580 [Cetobacterium sp.]